MWALLTFFLVGGEVTELTLVTAGSGTTAALFRENATDDNELLVLRPLYTWRRNLDPLSKEVLPESSSVSKY